MSVNPVDNPEVYDVFVLLGKASPGRLKIKVDGRDTGWDEQQAKGADGATTVKNGEKLVKFSCTFTLWRDPEQNRDDFTAMDLWEKLLDTPVRPKDPKALDCYHPELAQLKVSSCVLTKRGSRSPGEGEMTGSESVTHEFLEFRPPKPSPAVAPGGSADQADNNNRDLKDQLNQREQTFDSLRNQVANPRH